MSYIYIAIATFLFSSMEVATKYLGGQMHPVQLTFSRVFVGGVFLLPLAFRTMKKRKVKLESKSLGNFLGLGFCGITASLTLYQLAVTRLQASEVSIIFSSNTILVAALAFLILREPMTQRQFIGLVLDLLGILVIIQPWNNSLDPLGILFILSSVLLFSLYTVLGKKACNQYGAVSVTCFSFIAGSLEMIALVSLSHIPAVANLLCDAGLQIFNHVPVFQIYSLEMLPLILYVCVGVTGIGYACYFLAMEETSAKQASIVFFLKPIVAPVFAVVMLGETISIPMFCGILLILCGSLFSMLPKRKKI